MSVKILIGDVRDKLRELPDESVHCVVTSPPYWGLRDYGTALWDGGSAECPHVQPATGATQNKANNDSNGTPFRNTCGICGARRVDKQLGLEPTLAEHVAAMVTVFDEVWRVLRKDGTVWMNYGDSYASTTSGQKTGEDGRIRPGVGLNAHTKPDDRCFTNKPFSTIGNGLKPKDICGVPWRVAFALQERGWWLRQDIIWAKPNPMPESTRDRCTKAHEYIFLLAKSERYYFDQEGISEPAVSPQIWNGKSGDYYKASVGDANSAPRRDSQGTTKVRPYHSNKHELDDPAMRTRPDGRAGEYLSRNKRSVWTIATAPYAEAHFATFPPELPELCIKAGTSQKGCCAACGAPWVRQMEELNPGKHPTVPDSGGVPVLRNLGHDYQRPQTLGWSPSCSCNAAIGPAIVLDPFGGAGTTGLVADRLQRQAILIELNSEYAALARRRIDDDRGGLLDLMEAAQ